MLVHDLANELLDCWVEGDREGWVELKEAQKRNYPRITETEPSVAEEAERLARWQIDIYTKHRRIFGWRRQRGQNG